MTTAHRDVEIDRPIEEVFDFLADGSNNPQWQPRTQRTTQVEPALGVGTTFRQAVRHPLGFSVSADYQLTEFERPYSLSLVSISGGPLRPTESFELEECGLDHTRVRCTIDYRPNGLARFARPLLSFLHPLFAREASDIVNVRRALAPSS